MDTQAKKWKIREVRKWLLDKLVTAFDQDEGGLSWRWNEEADDIAKGEPPHKEVRVVCKQLESAGFIKFSEPTDRTSFSAILKPETYAALREHREEIEEKLARKSRQIGFQAGEDPDNEGLDN
jgi:hypothetical protein